MMDRLDNELREALKREQPPAGFAERVLARAAAEETRAGWVDTVRRWFRTPVAAWAAAACVLVAGGIAVEQRRDREMHARGKAAKAQLMLALRITGGKLSYAQAKVLEIGRPESGPESGKNSRRQPRTERQL